MGGRGRAGAGDVGSTAAQIGYGSAPVTASTPGLQQSTLAHMAGSQACQHAHGIARLLADMYARLQAFKAHAGWSATWRSNPCPACPAHQRVADAHPSRQLVAGQGAVACAGYGGVQKAWQERDTKAGGQVTSKQVGLAADIGATIATCRAQLPLLHPSVGPILACSKVSSQPVRARQRVPKNAPRCRQVTSLPISPAPRMAPTIWAAMLQSAWRGPRLLLSSRPSVTAGLICSQPRWRQTQDAGLLVRLQAGAIPGLQQCEDL